MKASKRKFFEHDWVEQRHEYLMGLSPKEACRLLETLDDDDVALNVNRRRFQESYICDYLAYLWRVSPNSFWRHIGIALTHPTGILVSDNDTHLEIMASQEMPVEVLKNLLDAVVATRDTYLFSLHLQVLFAQITVFGSDVRSAYFKEWFAAQNPALRNAMDEYIEKYIGDPQIRSKVLSLCQGT
jgi:hypothetical protein